MPETETRTCPACGQSVENLTGILIDSETNDILINGVLIHFRQLESTIFNTLYKRSPNLVTPDRLMDVLYADKPDELFAAIINVTICTIRRKIRGTRVRIESIWGRGYRLKLEPKEN